MKGKSTVVFTALLVVLAYVVAPNVGARSAWAQVSVYGSITGLIMDASQALIPGANVSVENNATKVVSKTVSNQSGAYTVLTLVAGNYTITIEKEGFKKAVRENVEVGVGAATRINATMEVGAITEQVNVTGASPTLQTETAEVNTNIDRVEVDNLPTLGRNISRLQVLVPGAVIESFQLTAHPENAGEDYRVSFNNQMFGQANRQLDGVDNNEVIQGLSMVVPNQESVEEVKITTSNYDAEYGTIASANIQVSTRSGTNDLHGSVFEYYRDNWMFARNPFSEPTKPAPFLWNQFGGSFGGPIKKNKLFYFADYQGFRSNLGGSSLVTTPIDAFRQGDFSSLAATNPIYDPTTGNPDGSGRTQFRDASRATSANPLGLNIIPQNRINSAATNLLGLLPQPNIAGATDNNYTLSGQGLYNGNQYNGRMDWNISDKSRLMGRYTYFATDIDTPSVFGTVAGGPPLGGLVNAGVSTSLAQNVAVTYNHEFSPSLLATGRFGFSRLKLTDFAADSDLQTTSAVGIPGVNGVGNPDYTNGLSTMGITGPVGAFSMGAAVGHFIENETVFNGAGLGTKIYGNHTMKFGADIKKVFFIRTDASGVGSFAYGQSLTGSTDVANSGLGMASFLLGLSSNYTRRITVVLPQEKQWRDGIFFQDNWKLTPKLTLNLGLRWEYYSPMFTGNFDSPLTNLDTNTGNILLTTSSDKYVGVDPVRNEWAPRVGFAYQLKPNTVLRAGFGRSYSIGVFGATFATQAGGYPNSQPQQVNQANPYTPALLITNGPPAPAAIPPLPASGQLPLPPGVPFIYFGVGPYPHQYTDSWNVTIQHQLSRDVTFEIGYVANVARNIWMNWDTNMPPPGPGTFNSRRPYFQAYGWDQGLNIRRAGMASGYNSLQAKIDKRFSNGFSGNSTFTYGRGLDEGGTGPMNQFNLQGDWGISDYSRKYISVSQFIWDLPFGPGKSMGNSTSGVTSTLISGWSISSILNFMSGPAFTPVLGDNSTLNSPITLRPNRDATGTVPNPTRNLWFDPSAFSVPALYTYGNSGRGILYGPGYSSCDFSFAKNFKLSERFNLQFQWMMLNTFNRTNLSTPDATVDSSTAGQITGTFSNMRRMQLGGRLIF
jgi:outer membrane receptor protein involved in Fe transport